jgi:hypothetical protein
MSPYPKASKLLTDRKQASALLFGQPAMATNMDNAPIFEFQVSIGSLSFTSADTRSTKHPEGPLEVFELFPNLPAELRLKIFKIAASEPRIITCGGEEGTRGHPVYSGMFVHCLDHLLLARLPLICLLSVNKEARFATQDVLGTYKTIVSNNGKEPDVPVNSEHDIFFVNLSDGCDTGEGQCTLDNSLYGLFRSVPELKHLAFDLKTWVSHRLSIFTVIAEFVNLETIIVIANVKPIQPLDRASAYDERDIPLQLRSIDKVLHTIPHFKGGFLSSKLMMLPKIGLLTSAMRQRAIEGQRLGGASEMKQIAIRVARPDYMPKTIPNFKGPPISFKVRMESGTLLRNITEYMDIGDSLANEPDPDENPADDYGVKRVYPGGFYYNRSTPPVPRNLVPPSASGRAAPMPPSRPEDSKAREEESGQNNAPTMPTQQDVQHAMSNCPQQ